jgi:hypothetical protein
MPFVHDFDRWSPFWQHAAAELGGCARHDRFRRHTRYPDADILALPGIARELARPGFGMRYRIKSEATRLLTFCTTKTISAVLSLS